MSGFIHMLLVAIERAVHPRLPRLEDTAKGREPDGRALQRRKKSVKLPISPPMTSRLQGGWASLRRPPRISSAALRRSYGMKEAL